MNGLNSKLDIFKDRFCKLEDSRDESIQNVVEKLNGKYNRG